MEEHAAIDLLAIGCQRVQFGLGDQAFSRAVPVGNDHLAPGVGDVAPALQNAAHLDRNDQRFAPPLPLARPDRDGRGPVVPQHHTLEQPQVFHGLSHHAGMPVQCALGQPFENQGHRKYGMTVDHVRPITGNEPRSIRRSNTGSILPLDW